MGVGVKRDIFHSAKTKINKIVRNYDIKFGKGPCTHVRTQCINVCAHIVSSKKEAKYYGKLLIVTTPTTTQPQHSSWVGQENDLAHHPPHKLNIII